MGNGSGGVGRLSTTSAAYAEEDEEPTEPDSLEEGPTTEELAWSSSASADLLF